MQNGDKVCVGRKYAESNISHTLTPFALDVQVIVQREVNNPQGHVDAVCVMTTGKELIGM
jgi:hypothetical protein